MKGFSESNCDKAMERMYFTMQIATKLRTYVFYYMKCTKSYKNQAGGR